jgi:patatin-related protein
MSSTETASTEPSTTASPDDVRELRLAVVLYGGASLAIYMHGTTKELHRLVRASTAVETGAGEAPGPDGAAPSERVWAEFLRELAGRDPQNVRTRVVVDVVAGTSAGGINGVFLSKALTQNQSLDALRDLWFTKGDIKVLLRGPGWLPAPLKIPLLLAGAIKKPVLKGDAIAQWMYEALRDMEATRAPGAPATLLPDRHPLELFVTVTDFQGYRRDVMIADPPLIRERAHRHVLTFRFDEGRDDFDRTHNGALAFAARTTMSFPGAFPPVSLKTFQDAVRHDAGDISTSLPALFRIYKLSGADSGAAVFIDGGVLDNKPFLHAIKAIRRRPAESEVDRKLIFPEPDPGEGGGASTGATPSPISTVLASVSGLPREEPVLDDILEVIAHNDRVARIRDIVRVSFDPIAQLVEKSVGDLATLAAAQSPEELTRWNARINDEAKAAAGFAYSTYVRSKVSGVVDSFARTVCRLSDFPDDCNQAAFVRAVLRAWARTRLYDRDGDGDPLADQVTFLQTFDLEYGARRIRFVIDGLSAWYRHAGEPGYPSRAELDAGKAALWDARGMLLDTLDGRHLHVNLTDEVRDVFDQAPIDEAVEAGEAPDDYVKRRADALALLELEFGKALKKRLDGFNEKLYATVNAITRGWAPERRADILVRYLGFPFWDVLLYPIQAVADAGERDAIEVVRMSPRDTSLLPPIDEKPKLSGFTKMHFGAFFDRAGRESDYLWGRLDAAERLIGLLGKRLTADERAAWCRRAFAAIVEEEDGALPNAKPLLAHARTFAAAGKEKP